MEIIKGWTRDGNKLGKMDSYRMTKGKDIISMRNADEDIDIEVVAFVVFRDADKQTGEEVEILSIMSTDGAIYACQSETFKNSFFDIMELGLQNTIVNVHHGTTKANRDYIDCILNPNSEE